MPFLTLFKNKLLYKPLHCTARILLSQFISLFSLKMQKSLNMIVNLLVKIFPYVVS